MNRGNAKMNAFAVSQLELAPTDAVLASLASGGFSNVRVARPTPDTPWNVVVAFRPA
jgi:hypothetical protein